MISKVARFDHLVQKAKRLQTMRARDEHTFLAIRVDSHEIAVGRSINSALVGNTIIQNLDDDSPVFTSTIQIDISGTCMVPASRATGKYTLAIRSTQIRPLEPKVRDIRVRGKDNLPAYRQHRSRQIPVCKCPLGFSTLEKIRGANAWHAAISVPKCTASDILAMLAQSASRPIYVFVHEHRHEGDRWIRELYVQTKNPAEE